MSTKPIFLATYLSTVSLFSSVADDGVSVRQTSDGWHIHSYPQIELRVQLPNWKADIEDQGRMWSFFAYPLVENPVTDVQYRVTISAYRYTEGQYLRLIRNYNTNSANW